MAPDLNSLPTSRPPSLPDSPTQQRPRRISLTTAEPYRIGPPSPRSPTLSSLQAAAQLNAGLHRSPSGASPGRGPGLERRRSGLINNLSIDDPSVPAPGEMQQLNGGSSSSPRLRRRSVAMATADPNHHRQPSLGELHQELESEQEAQVNRLLHMIRIQQDQLAAIQRQQQTAQDASPTATEHTGLPTPPSSTSASFAVPSHTAESPPRLTSGSGASHQNHGHFNRPQSLSRQSSARQSIAGNNNTSSRGTSPALRPTSGNLGPLTEDFLLGGTRDESAFYQAETQTLTRENQMLKLRIRELERQIADMSSSSSSHPGASTAAGTPRSPTQDSHLVSPPTTFTGEPAQSFHATSDAAAKVD